MKLPAFLRPRRALNAVACILLATSPAIAGIDNYSTGPGQGPGDTMCDVWQALYNAWGLDPNDDEDNDGCSNFVESLAGTDPRNTGDCHKVGNTILSAGNVVFSFDAEAGKKYRIVCDDLPNGPFTTVVTQVTPVNGATQFIPTADNASQTISVAKAPDSRKFYKLEVSDADSDNDGLSDWAEVEGGFDPHDMDGDSDDDGISDLDEMSEEVSVPDVITIEAAEPLASEDGPASGCFMVSRTRSLLGATVNFSLSGTAASPADYTPSPTASVNFAQGVKTAEIFVNPAVDSEVEGSESVTATLTQATSGGGFANPVIDPEHGAATVIIGNTTAATGTGLLARYYDYASSLYAHAANFGDFGNYTFTRGTPQTQGTILVTPTLGNVANQLASINLGDQVKLTFNGGNLNNAAFNHQLYTVTAKTGTNFTCSITSATTLPGNSSSNLYFSRQPTHLGWIERVDPTVDIEWMGGTPNGNFISPENNPDNWSSVWEGSLNPTVASTSGYRFQLDADDKARVLIDLNRNGTFDLPGEQVVEHGWDTAVTGSPEDGVADDEVLGTFKISAFQSLSVPANSGERYKIRVEQVETTGDARCRLQWSVNGANFANIPQGNIFSHVAAMNANYNYTRTVSTAGAMEGTILVTLNGHGYSVGNSVDLSFSSGNLFTPANGNFHGTYTVAVVNSTNSFTVNIAAPTLPTSGTGAGYVLNRPTTTNPVNAWYNVVWQNTTFSGAPGRVGTNNNGTNDSNNGLYGSGSPDPALIDPDSFTVRWTGQIQPQFTEEYTISVLADDGVTLKINGQVQDLKFLPSANNGGSSYYYESTTGETVVYYGGSSLEFGSVVAGEALRLDPANGNLNLGNNSTYTYDSGTGDLVVNYSNLTNVTPGGFMVGQVIEVDPTSGPVNLGLLPYPITAATATTFTVNITGMGAFVSGSGSINVSDNSDCAVVAVYAAGSVTYTYTSTTGDTVVNYAALGLPANTFKVGETVLMDPTGGNLSGQPFAYKTITAATATTFTVSYPTGSGDSTSSVVIVATDTTETIPQGLTGAFLVNFGAGKHANASVGTMNFNFVNKPFKDWASNGFERFVRIPMVGGTRYDIDLEYWESGGFARCRLFWYSLSQPKQIIPTERLYPSSVPQAPPAHVAETSATALVGGPFSYPVLGSNGGTVSVSGLPAGLIYANGVISGSATTPGDYQILITITNAAGTSTSMLNLHVEQEDGSVEREVWTGIAGTSISSIPVNNPPNSTGSLTSLQAPTDDGDNFGARIRGYITAPQTGNYYFWLNASDSAEFWLSNDSETVNSFKRATVSSGVTAKSPWMALEQGQRYYFEILHKAGIGSDHLSLGWSKPGEPTTAASEVVPGYVLSPYVPPAPGSTPGTLYVATMLAQSGAVTNGVGVATLRLSEDETVAYVKFDDPGFLSPPYNGLTGPMNDWHVHSDPYLTHASFIIYDGVEPPPGDGPQPDGSHKWTIAPAGTLSADEIRELIKQGKAYINLHTAAYPAGEIRGNFTLAAGSRTFTPPPPPPAWTDDSNTDSAAVRFLAQASYGGSIADITALKGMTPSSSSGAYTPSRYETWIDDQFTKPASITLPEVLRTENASAQGGAFEETLLHNAWWWNSISGQDQLRQRIAFALSQIHVVSGQGPLDNRAEALAFFYDKLAEGAFGNFRDILETTTKTWAMGRYLDMWRNDKPDPAVGRIPNENYAREIKQLFSVGLFRMWPDGTLILNSQDAPIDTYTQREIVGFAHVFTGWDYYYTGQLRSGFSAAYNPLELMREVPARHFTGHKRLLNNEVLPGLGTLGGQPLDPYATHISAQYNDPAYTALPEQELDVSHDQLFRHPNVGPFLCRQLIQRLVTSHPSRDYLYRVVQKFNDNGSGVRGDMQAVIKAILLDYEARSPDLINQPAFGKQREPLLRVAAAARAFRNSTWSGTYSQTGTRTITITTSTPHKLANGNQVFLDFTSSTPAGIAPWIGSYSATSTGTNTFTVQATSWATGTYSIPANSTTCTITMSSHWIQAGHQFFVDFTSGAANGDAGLDNTVNTVVTATAETGAGNFTFTIPAGEVSASARSGNVMVPRFNPGSYVVTTLSAEEQAANPGFNRRVTLDTNNDHHLNVGDQVQLNFSAGNPLPTDQIVTVNSIVDLNTYTVLANSSTNLTNQSDNGVWQFPLVSQPLTRSGNVNSRASTFNMGNTDGDIDQTPVHADTVFNYFLPDYKYPGSLASQGITTPEFQTTAETTVIRQSNFFYNGLFNPGNTNGISSFKSGTNALVLDFSPWMVDDATDVGLGAPVSTSLPWTHNQNIARFIDHMGTLLTANQLTTSAKLYIRNFVSLPITAISTGNPCTVTTSVPHGYTTDDLVCISGVTNGTISPTLNSTSTARVITVTGPSTFTVTGVNCTAAPNSSGLTNAHASQVIYDQGSTTPSTTQRRDRIRAIMHLILTSPDFTIQR